MSEPTEAAVGISLGLRSQFILAVWLIAFEYYRVARSLNQKSGYIPDSELKERF